MTTEVRERFESTSRYDGYSWKPTPESLRLLAQAKEILEDSPRAMTVRQLYYRLVAAIIIPNNVRSYQNLVGLLTKARKVDLLDTAGFVDRGRAVEGPGGYSDLETYLDIVQRAYSRHPNDGQPEYIEVWTEKDALSAVIGDVIEPYGATLVVSKGYTSYTVLVEAAARFRDEIDGRGAEHCHLLYFGDFDPSGEDIFRVIEREMDALTGEKIVEEVDEDYPGLHVQKIALTRDLIDEHNLPPMPAKMSDSRAEKFTAEHGDIAVELDALPPAIFEEIVREAVLAHWNTARHDVLRLVERREQGEMTRAIEGIRDRRRKREEG